MKNESIDICTASLMMSSQISATEALVKSLGAWFVETRLALGGLRKELSRTEEEFPAEMTVVKELLRAEKTRVDRLARKRATEIEKRPQFFLNVKSVVREQVGSWRRVRITFSVFNPRSLLYLRSGPRSMSLQVRSWTSLKQLIMMRLYSNRFGRLH